MKKWPEGVAGVTADVPTGHVERVAIRMEDGVLLEEAAGDAPHPAAAAQFVSAHLEAAPVGVGAQVRRERLDPGR